MKSKEDDEASDTLNPLKGIESVTSDLERLLVLSDKNTKAEMY